MPRFARLRHLAEQLLHTHDTPRRTAGAFALGVFFGFSPFVGFHTVLGLACAFAFKLNRVAVLIGVYTNLPWLMPPYYLLATVVGAAILGIRVPADLAVRLRELVAAPGLGELKMLAGGLAPLFWSFMLGATLGACVLAFVGFHLSLATIEMRRRQAEHRAKP